MPQPASKRLVTEETIAAAGAARTAIDARVKAVGDSTYAPVDEVPEFYRSYVSSAVGVRPVYNKIALRHYHAAVANRDNAPVKIYQEGDSFTESSAVLGKRIADMAPKRLAQKFPILPNTPEWVGPHYLPFRYAIKPQGASDPTTYTGTSGGTLAGSMGPGLRNTVLTSTHLSRTWTLDGRATSARLYYGSATVANSVMSVSVDGGAGVQITPPVTPGAVTDGLTFNDITFTGTDAHTVTVSWVSGEPKLAGLEVFYGNESFGYHVMEAGHSGFHYGNYIETNRVSAPSIQAFGADLYIVMLGANDKVVHTPTQYVNNMNARLQQVRAARTAPMSMLVVLPYAANGNGVLSGYTWEDYRQAAREYLPTQSDVAWFDLSDYMPATDSAEGIASGFYNSDKIHPSVKGAARMEQLISAAIDPDA